MPTTEYYGKLVTDDIPRRIEKDGQIPDLRKLTPEELDNALRAKILEEAFEVRGAKDRGEVLKESVQLTAWLGDLLYVYDITPRELAAEVRRFRKERGTENHHFLQSITIPDGQR